MDIRGVDEMNLRLDIIDRSTGERYCFTHAILRIQDKNFDLIIVSDNYIPITSACPDCIEEQEFLHRKGKEEHGK